MKKSLSTIICILGLGFFSSVVQAEAQVKEGLAGVTYISGGIGEGGQENFEMLRPEYNLRLMFANKSGEYVASVKVDVVDLSNYDEVIHDVSEGPMLFAKLPAGNYYIVVYYLGEEISKKIKVKANQAPINLYYHFKELT